MIKFMLFCLFGLYGTASSDENLTITQIDFVNEQTLKFYFLPPTLDKVVEKTVRKVHLNYSVGSAIGTLRLHVQVADSNLAEIPDEFPSEFLLLPDEQRTFNQSTVIQIRGVFLGRTYLTFAVCNNISDAVISEDNATDHGYQYEMQSPAGSCSDPSTWQRLDMTYHISVVRAVRVIDRLFMAIIFALVIFANIGMGCKIDLNVVREVLRKPIAPVIGFSSQFIIMPMLAFGIAKLLKLEGGVGLGFFAMGCAPGGGASNMYTYLLGGDVSLSVTMTLISTFASLGMVPLWLYTLGRLFPVGNKPIKIPFQNIIGSLVLILIPVAIGIIIKRKRPRVAKIITKCLRPILIIFILFIFTFGIWANLYVFKSFTPIIILAGCLLPWCGFIFGGIVSFVCRQKLPRIIAIAVETGIQNPGIPILLLKFSLGQPEGDLAVISPIAVSTFTPFPLWIACAFVEIRRRCCKKQKFEDEVDAELEKQTADVLETEPMKTDTDTPETMQSNNNMKSEDTDALKRGKASIQETAEEG